jgi:hypothetical protein
MTDEWPNFQVQTLRWVNLHSASPCRHDEGLFGIETAPPWARA